MTETGLPVARRRWAILSISLGTALLVIDNSIATIALPTITRALDIEPSAAVLVVTVYQLVLLMALLPFSALGDQIGHRRLYQTGQTVFAVASILCFFANSLPFLLIVRATQALAAAAALSVSAAMVRSIYPQKELGRGLGVNSVVIASAAALAPTLGGFILSVASWPWVFAIAAPFALLSLATGRALPPPAPNRKPYDAAGAFLCAAMFGLIVSGIESTLHGDSPVVSGAVIVAGLALAVVFIRRELHRPRPILPVDLLVRPVFALSAVAALCAFIGSMTFMLSFPFRLQSEFGFTPGEVGMLIAPWPLSMMLVGLVAGALSDRLPNGVLGAAGMVCVIAAMTFLAFPPNDPEFFDLAWRMALCGVGYGFFVAPNSRQIVGSAPQERAASAGALVSTTRLLGQTLGATLLAALLAFGLGEGPVPALAAAGFAAISALCSLGHLAHRLRQSSASRD